MESEDKNSLFSFGRAKPIDDENSPVLNIQPKNGPKMNVPRGIFHYVDRERDFGSNFKLPDMESPVDFSGRMKTKDNFINGFYIPMPYGMEPFNIQVMQERERDNEMGAAVGMEDRLEMALKRAKRMCKAGPTEECDEMLREYFRMKTEATEEEEAPLLEKLLKLTETVGNSKFRNDKVDGIGVLFGMPGIEPMYWKAKLKKLNNNNIRLGNS
uniref:Uncharacterized protein n=1 Tax=Acrobeloides nanus TaxID=290746 RepID=A0A914E9M1_9BILA